MALGCAESHAISLFTNDKTCEAMLFSLIRVVLMLQTTTLMECSFAVCEQNNLTFEVV
jgi:hypothetical protein